jgi:hypothetical protein
MRRFLTRVIRGDQVADEPQVQLTVGYLDEQVTDRQRLHTAVRGFPLTWWTVWTCILFTTSLGWITAASEPSRFSSHIYDGAKATLDWLPGQPMAAWGWLFVLGGLVLMVSTYVSPTLVVWVLRFSATVFLFHAVLIAMGAGEFHSASFSGTLLCAFVAMIHLETAQSIHMILHYRFPKGRT